MTDTPARMTTIDPGWPWDDKLSLSPAIKAGGFIFVSGQLALDSDGALVSEGDMEAQSRQIFRNVAAILEAGGSSLERVVKLTCYVKDFSDYSAYSRVRGEVFGSMPPASTTVASPQFLVAGALLEVDAVALG